MIWIINGVSLFEARENFNEYRACDFDVKVYSPEDGERLLGEYTMENHNTCKIVITSEDSYQAAARYDNPLVMNFANAHNPGGGFQLGATAQEEALCRCNTLYESISSKKAEVMYKYNNRNLSQVESDYMLLSEVCVFRNNKCELLKNPLMVGVITVPAPNRIGAAMFRRIRIMLLIAKENGYKNLVLDAWGCGAFHNRPETVAEHFKQVLLEENYGQYFDKVCFAIYGSENGKNIIAFRKCFENVN